MRFLYQQYASAATYPRHLGGFALFLEARGWVFDRENSVLSGSRSRDEWIVVSPEGEAFRLQSDNDGERRIETRGGIRVMDDEQLEEVWRKYE